MRRLEYTKPEIEEILAVVNFIYFEEPVFLGKWKRRTTKELAIELKTSESTINRSLDAAIKKVKEAYDKKKIKF